jgi:hypothetical protein
MPAKGSYKSPVAFSRQPFLAVKCDLGYYNAAANYGSGDFSRGSMSNLWCYDRGLPGGRRKKWLLVNRVLTCPFSFIEVSLRPCMLNGGISTGYINPEICSEIPICNSRRMFFFSFFFFDRPDDCKEC